MGKTTFGFLMGFATAVGVAYMAYKALLALPEMEAEAAERRSTTKIDPVRRTH